MASKPGATAALYQRVSDGTDRSVEQQNAANEEAARARGWTSQSYSDSVSASRFSKSPRPGWDALTADVHARKFNFVVLWEPSRGGRRLAEWAVFLDICRETGTGIFITSHGNLYDPRNAREWRNLAEDGVDSAYESEKTSGRSRRGVTGAAEAGQPTGRIPYGYRRTYQLVPGRARPLPVQEPHPDEAPIVREIITRIAQSEAVSRLVTDLAARKVRTRAGGHWSRSSICRLVLEGVVYVGKRRHNGGPLLEGAWPAIVEPDVYWAAVAVLRDPARKTSADARGGIRPGRAKWLLSYIARCSVCGTALTVHSHGRKEPVYRCAAAGGHAQAPVEWLDECVTAAIVSWCARPGVYELLTGGDDREALAAQDEAKAERARLEGFRQKVIDKTLDADDFAVFAAGIKARIAELDKRANELATPPALRDLLGASSTSREAREEDIRARWAGMPLPARRGVITTISEPCLLPIADIPADRVRPGGPAANMRNEWRITMDFKDRPVVPSA